jgi:hypothetical protein
MKNTRTFFLPDLLLKLAGSWIAALLLLSIVLACRSSSSSSSDGKCMGQVSYEGQTYTGGPTDSAEQAQHFACNNYCLDADPEFDAHYRIWNDSRSGAAAGHPPKKEAIYKDKELLDYLTKDCAQKCVASIKDGKLQGSSKCE